jgi:hydroxymethylpyrimidine/phosphomethylpyrimidine kinase
MAERPYVLSIAGIDPSAGAGLLADIKVLEQVEVYGLGIPTANTIQTEKQFFANQWLPSSFIIGGVKTMLESYRIKSVKIGIIENDNVLLEIVKAIKNHDEKIIIIWDPVMKSSTEYNFQDQWELSNELLKRIDIVTPNKEEWLTMHFKDNIESAVVLKGGHDKEKPGHDTLIYQNRKVEIPPQTDLQIAAKHGSGCVFSSALAGFMAKGEDLENACRSAKIYTEQFLASNTGQLGYHNGETALYFAR